MRTKSILTKEIRKIFKAFDKLIRLTEEEGLKIGKDSLCDLVEELQGDAFDSKIFELYYAVPKK